MPERYVRAAYACGCSWLVVAAAQGCSEEPSSTSSAASGGIGGVGPVASSVASVSGTGGGGGAGGDAEMGCVADVDLGSAHSCALRSDQTLWCWGKLLDESMWVNVLEPTQIAVLGAEVAEVSAGSGFTCARKTDGTLWCWGLNSYGKLGNGSSVTSDLPQQVVAFGAEVAEVAAGGEHACARLTDGTVWCWGHGGYGQLGNDAMDVENPVPAEVAALGADVVAIAAGGSHTCAVLGDGTLWCWGSNADGQLGDPPIGPSATPLQVEELGTNVADVAAGEYFTCARTVDGKLYCWGDNGHGQLGIGGMMQTVPEPTLVTPGTQQVAGIVASESTLDISTFDWVAHTCARTIDNALWCWGNNDYGQLGFRAFPTSLPTHVSRLAMNVSVVAAGGSHTCAVTTTGTLQCWGLNENGQLGNGTMDGESCYGGKPCERAPVDVPFPCP